MLVTGQKLLASEQIKYSAFFSYFVVLGNRTRDHQLKKIHEITIKVRAKNIIYLFIYFIYLFIYLLFFLGMAFLFFL